MIPILYNRTEKEFNTNGLGRLKDTISCTVEENRNGLYELEMQYPIDGVHYGDIELEALITARHSDEEDLQAFRIYRISRPINGIVTIHARHISYDLSKISVWPFSAASITEAFEQFPLHALNDCPFTFWTDKTTQGNFNVEVPSTLRSLLGGVQGSILDVYGAAEYEFDNYEVKLYQNRGSDKGVTIRYGKNLTDIERVTDSEKTFSGIAPFWSSEGVTVTLPEQILYSTGAATVEDVYENEVNVAYTNEIGATYNGDALDLKIIPVDLTEYFETEPTVDQLRETATIYLQNYVQLIPDENIKVSFIQLWQTEEYKDVAPLQKVGLCDIVTVIYPKLGVSAKEKVIKVVYNVLTERYDEVELGTAKSSLAQTIAVQNKKIDEAATAESVSTAIDTVTNSGYYDGSYKNMSIEEDLFVGDKSRFYVDYGDRWITAYWKSATIPVGSAPAGVDMLAGRLGIQFVKDAYDSSNARRMAFILGSIEYGQNSYENIVGFGRSYNTDFNTGSSPLFFYYSPFAKGMVCNLPLFMEENNITGAGTITAKSYDNYSDRRLKENIEQIPDEVIDRISSVPFCSFNYIGDKERTHYGVIAQDVQHALGDDASVLVDEQDDGKGRTFLALNYIEFLIARLAAAEKRIAKLEEMIAEKGA